MRRSEGEEWTGWWMIDAVSTSGDIVILQKTRLTCADPGYHHVSWRRRRRAELGSVICRLLLALLAGSDSDDDRRKPAPTIKRRINALSWTCRRQPTDCWLVRDALEFTIGFSQYTTLHRLHDVEVERQQQFCTRYSQCRCRRIFPTKIITADSVGVAL